MAYLIGDQLSHQEQLKKLDEVMKISGFKASESYQGICPEGLRFQRKETCIEWKLTYYPFFYFFKYFYWFLKVINQEGEIWVVRHCWETKMFWRDFWESYKNGEIKNYSSRLPKWFTLMNQDLYLLFYIYLCVMDWIVSPQKPSIEALVPNVTVFADLAFKEILRLNEVIRERP